MDILHYFLAWFSLLSVPATPTSPRIALDLTSLPLLRLRCFFFFLSFVSLQLFHACFIHLLFSSHHVVQSEDPDTYHHLYTIVRSTRTAASAVTVMYDAVHVHDTLAIFSRSDYNTVQFSNVNKTNSCMLTSYKMKICNFCHQNNTSVCHACHHICRVGISDQRVQHV